MIRRCFRILLRVVLQSAGKLGLSQASAVTFALQPREDSRAAWVPVERRCFTCWAGWRRAPGALSRAKWQTLPTRVEHRVRADADNPRYRGHQLFVAAGGECWK